MERMLERWTKIFWLKKPWVQANGCWFWTRYKNPYNGYGQMFTKIGRKTYSVKAHRMSYRIHKGPIPDGLHVLHTCDHPCCYNPEHLVLGTHAENMADRIAKGRHHFGKEVAND